MAHTLSKDVGVPVASYHLIRSRPTEYQSRMKTRQQRARNVRDAFTVLGRNPFSGRRLCLVDDVVTTGSTLEACGQALHRAGAKIIHAVTVARTPQW